VVGSGSDIAPSKYLMVFPCITDVWAATSLLPCENTKGIRFLVFCMGRRGRYPNDQGSNWEIVWIMC